MPGSHAPYRVAGGAGELAETGPEVATDPTEEHTRGGTISEPTTEPGSQTLARHNSATSSSQEAVLVDTQ